MQAFFIVELSTNNLILNDEELIINLNLLTPALDYRLIYATIDF